MDYPFRAPDGSMREIINPVIVQLVTDEGIDGFAVCFGGNNTRIASLKACCEDLSDVIIGQDINHVAEAWQKLWRATGPMGHQGYPQAALSAIDSALWAVKAKAQNMPLAHLLGGFRDKVPVYASHLLWRNWTVDELQKDAAMLVKKGFKAMKMRMGTNPFKVEIERYKAVREVVGDNVNIMLDCNWAYTVFDAIKLGRALQEMGLFWFEDPLASDDPAQIAQVADALDIPVVAGETYCTKFEFRRLIENRSADIFMVDMQRVGGVTEWMKVASMCQAWNIPVASHLFPDFSLHLVAAIPNGFIMEYMPWWDKIYANPYQVKDGFIEVRNTPGLGLELDPKALKKFAMK